MPADYTFSGSQVSDTPTPLQMLQPYPAGVDVYNDSTVDSLWVMAGEGTGGKWHEIKTTDPKPFTMLSAKGDINEVQIKAALGKTVAYRVVSNVFRDIVGGGGVT